MSIDPEENIEDQHQKYGIVAQGKDQKEAEAEAKAKFGERGLPIFWIKCNGEV